MRAVGLFLLGMVCGVVSPVAAHTHDRIVAMLEAKLSGLAHIEIYPGVLLTLVDCQCTIRYDGTKVTGHHYDVGFDRLD